MDHFDYLPRKGDSGEVKNRSTSLTSEELAAIRYAYPLLIPPPVPSLDELVYLFLLQYDVEIAPVGAELRSASVMAGFIGGYTGQWDAAFTSHQVAQDRQIAARAEWTSWKQWTLSHADWPSFRERKLSEISLSKEKYQAWLADPGAKSRIQQAVSKLRARKEEEKKRAAKEATQVAVIVVSLIALASLVELMRMFADFVGGGYKKSPAIESPVSPGVNQPSSSGAATPEQQAAEDEDVRLPNPSDVITELSSPSSESRSHIANPSEERPDPFDPVPPPSWFPN